MNTCGTCKYKGNTITRTDYDTDDCIPVTTATGYFLCDRAEMLDPMEVPVIGRKVLVADGSGYYAALCVEDDFGCNQWEGK